MAERHPSRTLLLVPQPGRARRARRAAVDPLLPDRRPCGLRRGDRADAARQPCVGAGVDRAAASDLGPAGVLPLARPAGVGLERVRAARRDRRPADRRLDRVAGPARRATRGSRSSSTQVVVSDIAWERTERWRSLLASLWPDIAAVTRDSRPGHARAGPPARRLAALAARARRRAWRSRSASGSRGSISTASRRRSRPASRRTRATSCRRSSTASPATRSTKPPFAPPPPRSDDHGL